jgi:hypothetical protein
MGQPSLRDEEFHSYQIPAMNRRATFKSRSRGKQFQPAISADGAHTVQKLSTKIPSLIADSPIRHQTASLNTIPATAPIAAPSAANDHLHNPLPRQRHSTVAPRFSAGGTGHDRNRAA